jgi:rhodanese-related sulfurtransferase
MSDQPPKSAVELAMERLRRKDEAAGVDARPPSEAQKEAIAEARRVCEAKLAEREILHKSTLARTLDPAERAALDDEYRRDRERIVSERERKIATIREEPR